MDTGRPVHQARSLDVARGISNFRTFADLIKTGSSAMFEGSSPDGAKIINYVTRKPLGTVGIISPRNLPLLPLTWKQAPPRAMGNCVGRKPYEEPHAPDDLRAEIHHVPGPP